MNAIDISVSILIFIGFVRGFMRGFFVEFATLLALVGGLYGALHFSFYTSDILIKYIDWKLKYIRLASFLITFLAIMIAVASLGKLLTNIVENLALGTINNLLGGIFGAAKLVVIVSFFILFFNKTNLSVPFVKKGIVANSILYKPISAFAPFLLSSFSEFTAGSTATNDDLNNETSSK